MRQIFVCSFTTSGIRTLVILKFKQGNTFKQIYNDLKIIQIKKNFTKQILFTILGKAMPIQNCQQYDSQYALTF